MWGPRRVKKKKTKAKEKKGKKKKSNAGGVGHGAHYRLKAVAIFSHTPPNSGFFSSRITELHTVALSLGGNYCPVYLGGIRADGSLRWRTEA